MCSSFSIPLSTFDFFFFFVLQETVDELNAIRGDLAPAVNDYLNEVRVPAKGCACVRRCMDLNVDVCVCVCVVCVSGWVGYSYNICGGVVVIAIVSM